MNSNKAFTLIELLVVVLIIGILAAIAVPQYQKAVLKAELHKGIPLVESLYQAQHAYYLTHGNFATDIDALDISIPLNENCIKEQNNKYSRYKCSFGTIGLADYFTNVGFQDSNSLIYYLHFVQDYPYESLPSGYFEKNSRYCFAKGTNKAALDICKSLGGEKLTSHKTSWNRYKIN